MHARINYSISLGVIIFFMTFLNVNAQQKEAEKDYTPYELLSSYYNSSEFKPFKKKTWYAGLAFSWEDKESENNQQLFQKILEGNNNDYSISVKGGYYTQDYNMVGLKFNYYQEAFNGKVLRDSDSIQSNALTRGYVVTPNLRSSIPLTKNERFSFFVELNVMGGLETSLVRNTKNIDEVSKTYGKNYLFGAAIAPGITFFAMENFAFEVQLNVLEYRLKVSDTTIDGEEQARVVQNKLGLNIDLLSLNLGLAYNFGRK